MNEQRELKLAGITEVWADDYPIHPEDKGREVLARSKVGQPLMRSDGEEIPGTLKLDDETFARVDGPAIIITQYGVGIDSPNRLMKISIDKSELTMLAKL